MRHLLALALLAVSVPACHRAHGESLDSGAPRDTGRVDPVDAPPPVPRDSGLPPPPPATIDTNDDGEGDAPAGLACAGSRTRPPLGPNVTFTAHVHDFQGGRATPTARVELHVFPGDAIAVGCAGACIAYVTDENGDALVDAREGSWIAYRVPSPADGDPVTTLSYQRVVPPAGGVLDLPTVSRSVLGLIPSLYSRTRLPMTGLLFGSLVDCGGQAIAGARLRLFREDGREVEAGPSMDDPFVGYFSAATGLPSRTATSTDVDGVFVFGNVPVDASLWRLELWASTSGGAPAERIACEAIALDPEAATILALGPARGDHPAGHPCLRL